MDENKVLTKALTHAIVANASMKLLTVKHVADRLKVSRYTVYRWISKGKLNAIRIDGILRIEEEAFNELLRKHKTTKKA